MANFLSTRAPDLAIILTLGLLVFTLLFQISQTEEKSFHETADDDSTPKAEQPVEKTDAREKIGAKKEQDERITANVTPEYLTGFYRAHLAIQANKLVEPYIGTWMPITGFVRDVTNHTLYTKIYLDTIEGTEAQSSLENAVRDILQVSVAASSDKKKWRDRFMILRRGEKITVFGKIVEVGAYEITLAECEIIDSD